VIIAQPYGLKPHQIVDYPADARWGAMAGPAAAARFDPEHARAGREDVRVFLEDEARKLTPIVAAMDLETADKLLCDLRLHRRGMGQEPAREPDDR
jgi:hypothetical protein